MGIPVYEIEVGFEAKAAAFLGDHGYEFLPKGKPNRLEGVHPGVEQHWSIISAGREVSILDIIETNKGKKILILGPLRDRKHKTVYRLLNDEIFKMGAKPLDDFNGAFEPSERTKN
jgi:hypothetical protein